MAYNYFEDKQPELDEKRKDNDKKKKAKKIVGIILIVIGSIVLLVALAWGIVRYAFPDLYFSELFPNQQVAAYVDENILGRTTTTTTTTQLSTAPTEVTTEELEEMTYLDSIDFDFYTDKKGALVGNILNGGKVCNNGGYSYYIYDGKGIYRLAPSSESYAQVFSIDDPISSLNVFSDYYYFVNDSNNTLNVAKRNANSSDVISENISMAYIYDEVAYCVSSDNKIVTVDINNGNVTELYKATDKERLSFVGISLDKVFFTSTNDKNVVSYLVVDSDGKNLCSFKQSTKNGAVAFMSMENGYMYYAQKTNNSKYNLIRQKFGSREIVTLQSDINVVTPVVVDSNKVFFGTLTNSDFEMIEYNMNSKESKTMLITHYASSSNKIIIQHGGEYDFIIGNDEDGEPFYWASSNLTAYSHVMAFNGSTWNY